MQLVCGLFKTVIHMLNYLSFIWMSICAKSSPFPYPLWSISCLGPSPFMQIFLWVR